MYSNAHAAALLLAFTPDQRLAIFHFTRSSSDPERDVQVAQAASPAAIPIFRLIDVGDVISAENIGNWQAGMATMFASLFTKVWTQEEVQQIIEKGARIRGDYAKQIASQIVSPDTDLTDFSYRLLSTVAELPFVPARMRAFAPAVGAAFSFLYSALGSKDFAADNSATMLRLGTSLNRLAVETLLTAAEAAYEARLSPQTLDGFGQTMQNVWQWLWGQSKNASPLLPAGAEGGDVYAPDAQGFVDVQRAARQLASAYEQGDPDAAAEIGFIFDTAKAIGKGASLGGRALAKKIRQRRAQKRARHRRPRRQDAGLVTQLRDKISSMGLDPYNKAELGIGVSRLMGITSQPAGIHSVGRASDSAPYDLPDDEEGDVEYDEFGDPNEDGDVDEAGDPSEDGDPNDDEHGDLAEEGDPDDDG